MSSPRPPDLSVAAVCGRDDKLLMVREGHGAAGGQWRLPGGTVRRGRTLAEAVVDQVSAECGRSVLCGPFLGWREHVDGEVHVLRMYFEGVDMGADDDDPPGAPLVAESEWVEVSSVLDRRLEPGLAEFLGDAGVIDAVV